MHSLLKTVNTTDTLTLFLEKSDRNRLGIRVENDDKGEQFYVAVGKEVDGHDCNLTDEDHVVAKGLNTARARVREILLRETVQP